MVLTLASCNDDYDSDSSSSDAMVIYRESTVLTLTFLRNDQSRPDPRQAMVVFGQPPSTRNVSDDQGVDFLSFPREIRNTIYKFVFVKQTHIGGETKFTKPFYRDALTSRALNFAGCCRQIWNESLRTFIVQNGFEFFFIRPTLEFLEKIGICGRNLLQKLRWHHPKHSRPFIVLRLFRSCKHLQELEIFARVTVKGRKNFWWGVPLLNAKRFFLTKFSKIEFGKAQAFGKGAKVSDVAPDFTRKVLGGDWETHSLRTLDHALRKVKWEISGQYERSDLPSIYEKGMCHWKYAMIDAGHAKKRRAAKKRKREEENAAGQSASPVTGAGGANEEDDDAEIEDDDGYEISEGNLLKDGAVVASGHEFDGEDLSEMNGKLLEGEEGEDTAIGGIEVSAEDNKTLVEDGNATAGGAMILHEH